MPYYTIYRKKNALKWYIYDFSFLQTQREISDEREQQTKRIFQFLLYLILIPPIHIENKIAKQYSFHTQ
jgi:hypothetical protein